MIEFSGFFNSKKAPRLRFDHLYRMDENVTATPPSFYVVYLM